MTAPGSEGAALPAAPDASRLCSLSAGLLDVVIALYVVAIAVVVATSDAVVGPLSVRHPAKPVLVLLLLVPLRVSIGGPSWLVRPLQALLRPGGNLRPVLRVSPAAFDASMVFALTQIGTGAVGFVANLLLSDSRPNTFTVPFERHKLAEIFGAWDSGWYFDIARRGYYFSADGQSSVAFFPLYPTLVRLAAHPFGGTDQAIWVAGILISLVSFGGALFALHAYAEHTLGDRGAARRTILYLAIFPFALFFSRVYAESVFLLTTVAAISSASKGRWVLAGVWGALATLTRPNGLLVAVPLVLLALRGASLGMVARRCVALLPVPAALAGYCAYVHALSGDPLAWLSSQAHWGYSLGHPPWEQILKMIERLLKYGPYDYFFVSNMAPYRLFHGVTALVFLALTPAVFKHLGVALGAYVLVSLLVPLSGNVLEGVGRYSAVLFPVFMVLGRSPSRWVYESLVVVSTLALALLVALFVTLHPIY